MDPQARPRLVAELDRGADMAVGRRRPAPGVRWPWHARFGTAAVCWRLRTRHGLAVHDIAPMRVARREALLDTLDAVAAAPVQARVVALTGDLDDAWAAADIRARLQAFTVIPQRGDG